MIRATIRGSHVTVSQFSLLYVRTCVCVCVCGFEAAKVENTLMPLGEAERVICECFRHLIPQNNDSKRSPVVMLFFPPNSEGNVDNRFGKGKLNPFVV